jgi:hypothetical protein
LNCELPLRSRAAAIRGDFISADQFSNLLDEGRAELRDLQKEITSVEVRLYRLRRSS